jgi:hypothetical protein
MNRENLLSMEATAEGATTQKSQQILENDQLTVLTDLAKKADPPRSGGMKV